MVLQTQAKTPTFKFEIMLVGVTSKAEVVRSVRAWKAPSPLGGNPVIIDDNVIAFRGALGANNQEVLEESVRSLAGHFHQHFNLPALPAFSVEQLTIPKEN